MSRQGAVRLSVLSHAGKEAVVAVLDVGHFFGEGCLAGQSQRMATATAMTASTILAVEKQEMVRQLHAQPAFADRFLTHMLTRNIRIEEDLIDQLFNSSEKRLARTLLLLARYGEPEASHRALPRVSQELLAEMVGTTRSRVNFFMNKFRKLGFIDYNRRPEDQQLSPDRRAARLTSSTFCAAALAARAGGRSPTPAAPSLAPRSPRPSSVVIALLELATCQPIQESVQSARRTSREDARRPSPISLGWPY